MSNNLNLHDRNISLTQTTNAVNNSSALQAAMATYCTGINNNNDNNNENVVVTAAEATATSFHHLQNFDFNGVAAQIFDNQFLNANNPYNGAIAAAAMIRENNANLTNLTSNVEDNSTSLSLSDATNSFTQQIPKIIHYVSKTIYFILKENFYI